MNKKKDTSFTYIFRLIHHPIIHIILKILTSHQVTPYGVLYLGGTKNYEKCRNYDKASRLL